MLLLMLVFFFWVLVGFAIHFINNNNNNMYNITFNTMSGTLQNICAKLKIRASITDIVLVPMLF